MIRKIIYFLPLALIFFFILFHSSASPDNLLNKTANYAAKTAFSLFRGYLTSRNFISNPSFESPASPTGQIPGWQYFGWQLSSKNSSSAANSIETVDLVKQTVHTLHQSINFLLPSNSRFIFQHDLDNSHSGTVNEKVVLTFHYLDLSKDAQVLTRQIPGSLSWQIQKFEFTGKKFIYRLDLDITIDSPSPTYLDNLSLRVL